MKNKLILLLIVVAVLVGLLVLVNTILTDKDQAKTGKKASTALEQTIRNDSPQSTDVHASRESTGKSPVKEASVPSASSRESKEATQTTLENEPKTPAEDYSSYINTVVSNTDGKDISVLVLENDAISTAISSSIAKIYTQTGAKGSTGLIKSTFIRKPGFQELCEGNSGIIEKLDLKQYTDYLALGRIIFSCQPGKLVEGTIVCNATLTMSLLSINDRTLANSFSFSVNANGASESQARDEAIQKLLSRYKNEYSSL